MKSKTEIGMKINRLKLIEILPKTNQQRDGIFECDCGNKKKIRIQHVRCESVKSCGCYNKEVAASRKSNLIHGMCGTPTYESWLAMRARCLDEKHIHYSRYGGRGILICHEWDDFEKFFEDMGHRPNGKTLDRIKSDGNYCKENCKWSTPKEQSRNLRSNRVLEFNGVSACVSEWAEKTGIKYTTLKERLNRGWSVERSLGYV